MSKLDESKVRYIIRKSRNGTSTSEIAEEMNVSARWIRKLCARYGNVDLKDVAYPMRMGRRPNGMPGRREESAVLTHRQAAHLGATELEDIIEAATGIHISHNTIHDNTKEQGDGKHRIQEERQAKVSTLRAHVLQLHVAYGLQAAERRQVAPVLRGRRLALRDRVWRL